MRHNITDFGQALINGLNSLKLMIMVLMQQVF